MRSRATSPGASTACTAPTFTLPEGYVPKAGAKIMSLGEPTKKMSKSDPNVNSFILMTDDKDTIVRKFKRAVTDSDGVVRFDAAEKPGVSKPHDHLRPPSPAAQMQEIEAEFAGRGYGDFKLAVAETTADALAPVQAEYARLLGDKAYVDGVLKDGAGPRRPPGPGAPCAKSTARSACCSWKGKRRGENALTTRQIFSIIFQSVCGPRRAAQLLLYKETNDYGQRSCGHARRI